MTYLKSVIFRYFEPLVIIYRNKGVRRFFHNFCIHPICACLPSLYAERLHGWHVKSIHPNHWSLNKQLNDDRYVLFTKTREDIIKFLNDEVLYNFGSQYAFNDTDHSEEITEFTEWLYEYIDNEIEFSFESDVYHEEFKKWITKHNKQLKLELI